MAVIGVSSKNVLLYNEMHPVLHVDGHSIDHVINSTSLFNRMLYIWCTMVFFQPLQKRSLASQTTRKRYLLKYLFFPLVSFVSKILTHSSLPAMISHSEMPLKLATYINPTFPALHMNHSSKVKSVASATQCLDTKSSQETGGRTFNFNPPMVFIIPFRRHWVAVAMQMPL